MMKKPRARIVAVLRESGPVVTLADIARALEVSRLDASKIASRWVQQGRFVRIRRGVYAPVPIDSDQGSAALEDPWQLVPELFGPAFVTGWSAAEHWDLTEQLFRRICVKTAREVRRKAVRVRDAEFHLTHVSERELFGLRAYWTGGVRVDVADPHRTVLDMLDSPALGGGARHVGDCLTAYFRSRHAASSQLVEYGDRIGNGAVFKRLGFLAERNGVGGPDLLNGCRVRLTKGYASLDPDMVCTRVVTRWRLRVPDTWIDGKGHD